MTWNWWLNKKHSVEVMDYAAQRLGAPNHKAFLLISSPALTCAFKLICDLIAKFDPPVGSPEREYLEQHYSLEGAPK